MRKIIFALSVLMFFNSYSFADVISGKIDHDELNIKNKIIDSKTKQGLSNAKITIPELHYTTYSDKDGAFQLNADVSDKTVLFVEKEGYKASINCS